MKKKVLLSVIFFLILIIGFYFRIMYLETPLWYDEACSWASATSSYGVFKSLLIDDMQHTPLYFFILHFWINIFSDSEIAMRSLSLIFGILSLPLVFQISKKLLNTNNALIVTTLCSFSPLLVIFSSEVRMYSMVIFLVLLSLNFLIDYEQKHNLKSLYKMGITNILIPYTFVGGIFYNFSLLLCYGFYLFKHKKDCLKKFLRVEIVEWIMLIPYFILLSYYFKMRKIFIVEHEGAVHFSNFVDIIKNFFSAYIDLNVYWPTDGNYNITFLFALMVILPCSYFIYGIVKTLKSSDTFSKTLVKIMLSCLCLITFFALCKINVLTVRYIIYILPMLFILSVKGLAENLTKKHLCIFLALFLIFSAYYDYKSFKIMAKNKENSFKIVAEKCLDWGIDYRDVLIMPFGSDAPYYFKNTTMPVVFNADFHKIVRNPYGVYYDIEQRTALLSDEKYKFILGKIKNDEVFSKSFTQYFYKNVVANVDKGRYAILVMFGDDNNIIKPIAKLREEIKTSSDVKSNILYVMFSKYMCDIIAMLNANFNYIETIKDNNYTYYVYQKK